MGQPNRITFEEPTEGNARLEPWYPSGAEDFVVRWTNPSGSQSRSARDPQSNWLGGLINKRRPASANSRWLMDLVKALLDGNSNSSPAIALEDVVSVDFCGDLQQARVLITTAVKQELVAASIRFSDGKKSRQHQTNPPIEVHESFQVAKPISRASKKFLFSPDAVCEVILRELRLVAPCSSPVLRFEEKAEGANVTDEPAKGADKKIDQHPTGLIVVAGSTGTGKSLYAKGLALRWLLRLAIGRYRKTDKKYEYSPPHLVTFEDPIEGWKLQGVNRDARPEAKEFDLCKGFQEDLCTGIRVTARAGGHDVADLKRAYTESLRQKPNVVYIGECRDPEDWKLALELGATGHLVITTCHASSLIDTFVKLVGTESQDAQSRRKLAGSLRGVLHLKQHTITPIDQTNFSPSQTFFHLWRPTQESISNFVVDGLASLVTDGENILGRSTLTDKILKLQSSGCFDKEDEDSRSTLYKQIGKQPRRDAFRMDIARE